MARTRTPVIFPPRALVPKTADDDPIDYYYAPLTSWLYRSRLRIAADLLGERRHESLLEIGYGSGIFLPELARRATRVCAIDVHEEQGRVEEMLRALGIEAELATGSIMDMPFEGGTFDAVVCMSVLEHLHELDRALGEIRRVLRPGGKAVLGFPVRNPLTDSFFRLVGYNPREIHPSGHRDILAAAGNAPGLGMDEVRHFPRALPTSVSAYVVCRLRASAGTHEVA